MKNSNEKGYTILHPSYGVYLTSSVFGDAIWSNNIAACSQGNIWTATVFDDADQAHDFVSTNDEFNGINTNELIYVKTEIDLGLYQASSFALSRAGLGEEIKSLIENTPVLGSC